MSWIQVTQEQIITGDIYTLKINIVNSNGIDQELFLFSTTDDKFQHVAKVEDLHIYPRTKADALSQGTLFYRKKEMEVNFYSKETAANASGYTQTRLKQLVLDWTGTEAIVFGGIETFVYDSQEP